MKWYQFMRTSEKLSEALRHKAQNVEPKKCMQSARTVVAPRDKRANPNNKSSS